MAVTLNASTSTGYIQTADTSGDLALQSNGTTQFNVTSTGAYGQVKSGTSVTASGTSVEFTAIPSWVKRITVMFSAVSTSGTNALQIQLGAGSVTTSGYYSNAAQINGGTGQINSTSGMVVNGGPTAAATMGGIVTIALLGSNIWVAAGSTYYTNAAGAMSSNAGTVTLGGTLDRLRIIASATGSPSDTFDAGSINILYEG